MTVRLQVELSLQLSMTDSHTLERFGTVNVDEVVRQVTEVANEAVEDWQRETKAGHGEVTGASVRIIPLYG